MRFREVTRLNESFTVSEPNGLRGPAVADVQKALKAFGFSVGPMGVDGILGPYTEKAIKDFQTAAKMPVTGHPDQETIQHINTTLQANPEVAANLTPSTDADVKGKKSASKIDTSAIQDPDFNAKLEKIANELGVESSTLLAIIKHESRGNPQAEDPKHVSIGLIGFTGPTAAQLGTSKDELRKMTAVEQLDYVYKFYKMVGVKPGMSRGDIYMLTFMPAFVKSSDDVVLGRKNGGTLILPSGKSSGLSMNKVWEQNPVFGKSRGKDFFTVGDVRASINSRA
jgi:peptidoglycan hydrolase-like protein with peptidoglycan-binding domain